MPRTPRTTSTTSPVPSTTPRASTTPRTGASSKSLRPVKSLNIEAPAGQPRVRSWKERGVAIVRSPSKSTMRTWIPWRSRGGSRKKLEAAALLPPALVAQVSAELVVDAMSSEIADAVHAAAHAAADTAQALGLVDDEHCVILYNAAVKAASQTLQSGKPARAAAGAAPRTAAPAFDVLDSAPPGAGGAEGDSAARVEAILTRSIQKCGVRVVDLFKEWDTDRNGLISKRELRSALKGTGIGASAADIDALFAKWDVDGSGAIDYAELNKVSTRQHTMPFLTPLSPFSCPS